MARIRKRGSKFILDYRMNGERKRLTLDSKSEANELCEKFNTLKRAKKSEEFHKLLAAREALVEAEAKLSGTTLAKAMFEYASVVSKRKSRQTQKNEKHDFKNLFQFLSGEKDVHYLREITPPMLQEYQGRLLELVSPSTCNRRFVGFKHFFNICVEWGYLEKSPARLVKTLPVKTKPREIFEDKEVIEIAKRLPPRFRRPFLLTAIQGLRPGDAPSARIYDYDREAATLRVYCEKGSESMRIVELQPASIELIEEALAERVNLKDSDFIFTNKWGKKLAPSLITKDVRKIRRKLGIVKRKTPYGLRHTFATKCVRHKVPSEVTRQLMGHASSRTTENYYKLTREDLKRTNKEIAKVFEFTTGKEIETVTNGHKIG